jgi:hypothetical protein
MVSAYVPIGLVFASATVRVELAAVAGFGAKVAVAPAGSPVTLKFTPPANPPVLVMLTTYVVLVPCLMDLLAGVAERLKSPAAGGLTMRVTVVVRVGTLEPVPVIVIV